MLPNSLEAADRCLQIGDLVGAARILQTLAAEQPETPAPWFLLGMTRFRQQQWSAAEFAFRTFLEIVPHIAEAWSNFGLSLSAQLKFEEAEEAFHKAIELKPTLTDAYRNLAILLDETQRTPAALAALEYALKLEPHDARTRFVFGRMLRKFGDRAHAIEQFKYTIRVDPNHVEARVNLGESYFEQGLLTLAAECFQIAITLDPNCDRAHSGYGIVLVQQKRFDIAIQAFETAVKLNPQAAVHWSNLGNAQKSVGDFTSAMASLRHSLQLDPDNADTHVNIGSALEQARDYAAARESFLMAIGVQSDHPTAHHNLALNYLRHNEWEDGWKEYEWRWRCGEYQSPRYKIPAWQGESLAGRTILLHCEQGLGDAIQFIRFAAVLKSRGATVHVDCPPRMNKLFSKAIGVDQVINGPSEQADYFVPLMSLPMLLHATPESVPRPPYLFADEERVARWRQQLGIDSRLIVGLVWKGNPKHKLNHQRSMSLSNLEPLLMEPDVRFISLQKNVNPLESKMLLKKFALEQLPEPWDTDDLFVDTAAVMMLADVIISIDSAPAHLAGALGRPVWMPLAFDADWRWLIDTDESFWYPTMKLYRQSSPGDWSEVVNRLQRALRELGESLAIGRR